MPPRLWARKRSGFDAKPEAVRLPIKEDAIIRRTRQYGNTLPLAPETWLKMIP
jgi:hypothetical protein